MSDTASEYACYILNKYFGEAATVSTHILCVKGSSSLSEILRDSHKKLHPSRVCKCLISLVRHSMLNIQKDLILKYSLNYERIFFVPRLPLFCKLVFHYYGKVAEQAMIYFSMFGRGSLSDLLVHCVKKHLNRKLPVEEQHSYVEALGTTVTTLVKTNVLQIVNPKLWSVESNKETNVSAAPPRTGEAPVHVNVSESEMQMPKDDICEALHNYISSGFVNWPIANERNNEPVRKRAKRYDESSELVKSLKLVVCPNIQTLETMWRDRLICQLASEKLGEICGDILSHLLCIATAANRGTGITSPESGAVSRSEIERKVLLPQSDFRRILPRMVSMGFITTTELSRTKEYTADTIFCLYSINLLQVARLVIELSQHEVFRISLRRDYEFSQKSRLIEQRYRIETLILQHQTKLNECNESSSSASLNDSNDSESQHKESIESLKSSITPAELNQLTVLSNKLSK
ncbi:hypothetical protein Smp_146110 [Schistosoma mansoni]|uniref:hypothetical protein n=1 Tax=Schistosoma mansoni TaxID=6183 RepID=UPI0001A63065|nr:hypothetical protein Smp_146110 [Schistosoma mansoni]|eukprot:XP_018650509.1 hypothetical protein Smp_146110 [Schistosoma mansoni]